MHKIDVTAQPDQSATTESQPETAVDEAQEMSQNQESQPTSTLHQLDLDDEQPDMKKRSKSMLVIISLAALVAGTATGIGAFQLSNKQSTQRNSKQQVQQVAGGQIKKGDVFGVTSQNSEDLKDSAQGYLELGGIDGEGSHRLLRAGGQSQTVYLTSTVTDLDKLVGMEVKVWGETYKGQQAGWLMDVVKIEVLNPDAEAPVEETL
jgi:hypothetical protein